MTLDVRLRLLLDHFFIKRPIFAFKTEVVVLRRNLPASTLVNLSEIFFSFVPVTKILNLLVMLFIWECSDWALCG